jgi:hypothetical protein
MYADTLIISVFGNTAIEIAMEIFKWSWQRGCYHHIGKLQPLIHRDISAVEHPKLVLRMVLSGTIQD